MTLTSGNYRPNDAVKVTVWDEGQDPPAGFDLVNNADGSKSAVRMARGDVVRGPDGSAASLPEGGALIEYPDGRYETLQDEDARNDFARRYLGESPDVPGAADTVTVQGTAQTAPAETPATPVPPVEEIPPPGGNGS